MHDSTKLKQVLDALAQRYRISNLRLNGDGAVGLELQDDREICLEYQSARQKLFAYTPLVDLPRETAPRQAMLEAALRMSCLESGTACGTVALDRLGETLLLQGGIDLADLDLEKLDRMLSGLLAQHAAVLQALKDASPAGRAAPSAAGIYALALRNQGARHV